MRDRLRTDPSDTRRVEPRLCRLFRASALVAGVGLAAVGVGARAQAAPDPAAPQPAAAPSEVLTLAHAVALAMDGNVAVRNAALEVERAEERIASARTRRFPKVNLSADASYLLTPLEFSFDRGAFGAFPGIGPVPGADTVIEVPRKVVGRIDGQVAQPLTQLHRIGLSVELAAAARDLERERLRGRRLDVAAEVKRLYFGLVSTESDRAASRQALALYEELDRLVADYVAKQPRSAPTSSTCGRGWLPRSCTRGAWTTSWRPGASS